MLPRRSIALCLLLLATAAAAAQQDADTVRRLERQLRQLDADYRLVVPQDRPIAERLTFDAGGSIRFAFLGVDSEFGTTRMLRQTDGILYLRAELDRAHRFYGRLRFLYDDFNSGDSFDGRGDGRDQPIGDRWWYQFDLRGAKLSETGEAIDGNVNVKAGRQFVQWGSGLAFSDVLYAAQVDVEVGDIGLVGLAGITPGSSTIDFDGSRPGFDTETERAYYGGRLEYRGSGSHRPYVSFLAQRDENDQDALTFSTLVGDIPTRFDYDSEYWAIGSHGSLGPKLTYRLELVYQTGDALSNSFDDTTGAAIEQTTENIEALAGIASLSWLFRDDADSRLEVAVAGGTGDDDRIDASDTFGGNRPGTRDNAFNGLGYINTGLVLAPEVSNLLMLRMGYSTSPIRSGTRQDWLRLGVTGFLYGKVDDDAPVTVATGSDFFIGGEVDFAVDWRLTSDLTVGLRYGLFLPGDAMLDGRDDPRHFVYAGVTLAF